MIGILVPIILFIVLGAVIWKHTESRHMERMAIIDKGLNPTDYKELYKHHSFTINPLSNLKWGLLAIFVGLGSLTAMFLYNTYRFDDTIYPGVILVFGGAGLIVFYFIASKKLKEPS